jgi:hypothetical protein
MAKHKQQQALFDLLRKERGGEHAGEGRPAPVVRPLTPASDAPAPVAKEEKPRTAMTGPMTKVIGPRGPAEDDRIQIPWVTVGLGALAVVALSVIGYYVVGYLNRSGPPLPDIPPGESFKAVQAKQPDPNMVRPWALPTPTQGPVGVVTKTGAAVTPTPVTKAKGTPTVTDTAPPAGGPLYRVQIAQVPMNGGSDQLMVYLAQHGIEVDRETVRGNYLLFSAAHVDKNKAKDLAGQINKHLEDFQKETGIRTSHDALAVPVKKE